MNPKPLSGLNHFTVPFVRIRAPEMMSCCGRSSVRACPDHNGHLLRDNPHAGPPSGGETKKARECEPQYSVVVPRAEARKSLNQCRWLEAFSQDAIDEELFTPRAYSGATFRKALARREKSGSNPTPTRSTPCHPRSRRLAKPSSERCIATTRSPSVHVCSRFWMQ